MKVSDLNVLVNFLAYSFTKNEYGGTDKILAETISGVWANIKDVGGSTAPVQAQMKSDISYQVTVRYNEAFTTNWNIEHNGQLLTIKHIKIDDPAYARFMIMDCSVSLDQTSWS